MTILVYSYPTITLENGFIAIQYDCSGWSIYHKDNPRQAVWHTIDSNSARAWARLPEYKKLLEDRGYKAAITKEGALEVYVPWTERTPFGTQTGFKVHKFTNPLLILDFLKSKQI